MGGPELIILANRAYLDHDAPPGQPAPARVSGGLVAALAPVVGSGTLWIGAGRGRFDREFVDREGFEELRTPRGALRHRRLFFEEEIWRGHYAEAANGFLWPLLHLVRPFPRLTSYFPVPCTPSAAAWAQHEAVAAAFAEAALSAQGERVWVHDYQLGLVPGLLRERGFTGMLGFFLHTPFPNLAAVREVCDDGAIERFGRWLRSLFASDLVGVQSPADAMRLYEAAVELLGAEALGDGRLRLTGHVVAVEPIPVGVNAEDVEAHRGEPEPAWLAELRARGLPLVVALERADYTKGIPERLRAVAAAYARGARFVHVAFEAPTRAGVPAYERLRQELAGATDAARRAAEAARAAFLEEERALPWHEVVALLRTADVVLAPSLADGMNLVPLQAVVAQGPKEPSRRATVLVGRDAGAASVYAGRETDGFVPVDPLDTERFASEIIEALDGRPGRISDRLVAEVRRNDARTWARRFLNRLEECHART